MRTRALVVLVATLMAIAACTNTGTTTQSASTAPAASATAAASASPAGSAEPSGSGGASGEPSGGASASAAAVDPTQLKIGMVTDIGQLEDKSFNEFSWKGVQAGAAAIGAPDPQVIVTRDPADYAANIQQFVDQGFNVIVTVGFLIGTDTRTAALQNPDVQFFGVDQFVAEPNPPNYQGILFAEAEPGYLAGIVAATVSETGVIGAVGGQSDVPPVLAYINGYRNGAASVNPDIEVIVQYAEDFNDPAKGEAAANAMIQQDADVIFQVAGLTGAGALRAACAADIWGIGVDVDQHASLPDAAECIITSAEKKLENAVSQAIQRYAEEGPQGGAENGNFFNNAQNEGIGLSEFTNLDPVPEGLQEAVDEALAKLKDGSLNPCEPIAPTRQRVGPLSYRHVPAPPGSAMTEATSPPILEMRGITKRFPGTVANDRIDLEVRAGEVHALLGENGAGKSTLMNILYGLIGPDEGEIVLDGQPVEIRDPADAIQRGIGMVHQHFMLVPVLTVAENVILGQETVGAAGMLDLPEAERRIRTLAEQLGFRVDPRARIDQLSVGQQQRVEILKALYRGARLLVLDEPTAVLTPQETQEIFAVLARLKAEGTSIVFISHKLDEVLAIADRITVIRRGRVVGTRLPSETDERDLAELMVGREVSLVVDRGEASPGEVVFRVEGLRATDDRGNETVAGVDLEIRAGEILGIAGVAGNGQDELVECIVGLRKPAAGKVTLKGRDVTGRSPRDVRAQDVACVPGDRQRFGLVLTYPIEDNLILTAYHEAPYARRGIRNDRAIDAIADELIPAVRHPRSVGDDAGQRAFRRQPAEGRRCAGVQRTDLPAHPRPADARSRRRQHRVHPPPGHRQARRRDGDPARLRGAGRGPRAVGPGRGHVPGADRRDVRRGRGGEGADRAADGARRGRGPAWSCRAGRGRLRSRRW